jgi:hypothetical protein
MSRLPIPLAMNALLVAAVLLVATPSLVAGDRVHAGRQSTPSPAVSVAVTPPAPLPIVVSVATRTASQPAKERAFVDLRGPDGQVRRFPLEGGSDVIQVRRLVLRPGDSLTIQFALAK